MSVSAEAYDVVMAATKGHRVDDRVVMVCGVVAALINAGMLTVPDAELRRLRATSLAHGTVDDTVAAFPSRLRAAEMGAKVTP